MFPTGLDKLSNEYEAILVIQNITKEISIQTMAVVSSRLKKVYRPTDGTKHVEVLPTRIKIYNNVDHIWHQKRSSEIGKTDNSAATSSKAKCEKMRLLVGGPGIDNCHSSSGTSTQPGN